MAAGKLPIPGSTLGPCEPDCQHRDCAATRRQAGSACRLCRSPIGYEVYFYQDEEDASRLVHARCLEEAER